MGMSNAERQRKFRLLRDADPERRQEFLKRCKEKYQEDKRSGKKKLVKDMTEREKRAARKQWRIRQYKSRQKAKESKEALTVTPLKPISESTEATCSRQKTHSKKQISKSIAKCYRDIRSKDTEIERLKRKVEVYRKRLSRAHYLLQEKSKNAGTPRTKTRQLLKVFSKSSKSTVRRSLFKFHVLVEQLRKSYQDQRKTEKLKFARMINGSIMKKYRMKIETLKLLTCSTRTKLEQDKTCLSKRTYHQVQQFYCRDDNSRLVAGMKKTLTKRKVKKQRRILNDSLLNLHKKFLTEGKDNISYTTFTRLRPFWVLFPTETDRDTCICKICDNMNLMTDGLFKSGIIEEKKVEDIMKSKVCDIKNYYCMHGKCSVCKDRLVKTKPEDANKQVEYFKWVTKREKRQIKEGKDLKSKTVTYTVKERICCSADRLKEIYDNDLNKYCRHIFTFHMQYNYYSKRKETMGENECIIHVDFSENYVCKMAREVQGMHFGASKKQLTLHTGVIHVKDKEAETFCTVSDSLVHNPSRIWAHVKPILQDVRKRYPNITSIEFFSDGPTAQYRQKDNFYLASTVPKFLGFESMKWSYFEAGHGKGVPDAVGGAIKRAADNLVLHGTDITSAEALVDQLKGLKSKLILIKESEIREQENVMQGKTLSPVPETLNLHQVVADSPGKIYYRRLSCMCSGNCERCHEPLEFFDLMQQKERKQNRKKRKSNASDFNDKQNEHKSDKKKCMVKDSSGVYDACTEMEETYDRNNKDRDDSYEMEQISTRKATFQSILTEINKCTSYLKLQQKCQEYDKAIRKFHIECQRAVIDEIHSSLKADIDAVEYMPDDIKSNFELCPCSVCTDGNCLPSSGSVLAYGQRGNEQEIRVRIIKELVENEEIYLDDKYLARGTGTEKNDKACSKSYAQYSDKYVPGMKMTKSLIKRIYQEEVLSLTEDKSFMGIRQLHALSSILKAPLYSVYPKLGNPSVRRDLHRLIEPIKKAEHGPVYIMWTSCRTDMNKEHWVPNHFVPLLPIEFVTDLNDTVSGVDEYREQSTKYVDVNNNEDVDTCNEEITIHVYRKENGEYDLAIDCEVPLITNDSDKEKRREDTSENITDTGPEEKHDQDIEHSKVNLEINDINQWDTKFLIGKYVLVKYREKLYPGLVENKDGNLVQIKCIKKSGRDRENNFIWPKKSVDLNWYDIQDIIRIIPNPVNYLGNRFKLDDELWRVFKQLQ